MKVKQITYSTLRVTRQHENDRVEFTVELEKGDKVTDVVEKVKEMCATALKQSKPDPGLVKASRVDRASYFGY